MKPSEFMRERRPEYYSDSAGGSGYRLDPKLLEYTLDTLSSRNEHQKFEIFARNLCQRAIAPNLRPATGPEGGGDGKIDTETYPVADEISNLYFVADVSSGKERWAFAFSVKEKWAEKARADVKNILSTGRVYDRIIFVTSRFTRDKTRYELEDKFEEDYGVSVTIHDRSWIVKEVIDGDRKDIAFNYLDVGEVDESARIGPNDYARIQQLEDIEKELQDPTAFVGMERQRATEALVAAKLSRNLERPRVETDGRFARAMRLAEADGSFRQRLRAKYEAIWTAVWWFDDHASLIDQFEHFESLALESSSVDDLQLLQNLIQLFVNAQLHGSLSPEQCAIDARYGKLVEKLSEISLDANRPNSRLEARFSLQMIRLNRLVLAGDWEPLPELWKELKSIVEEASCLAEFAAEPLIAFVELAGNIAGNDPGYNELVEKVAEFVDEREGEISSGLLLLRRAQQLELSEHFEMIRLLGKSARRLLKREQTGKCAEALYTLSVAYKSAGLPWAARANAIFALGSLLVIGEEDSELPVEIVPSVKLWTTLACELGYVPEFLAGVQLLNGFLAAMPLSVDSKSRVQQDIQTFDYMFAGLLLSISDEDLARLSHLPDILLWLGLFLSNSALLFRLGYEEELRQDGMFEGETSEDVRSAFGRLMGQWAEHYEVNRPILNVLDEELPLVRRTKIMGMTVTLSGPSEEWSVLLMEAIAAALEAFFATALDLHIAPHTEQVEIRVAASSDAVPSVAINETQMTAVVNWPAGRRTTDYLHGSETSQFLVEVCGTIFGATCSSRDMKGALEALFRDELVGDRLAMIAAVGNSHHRFCGDYVSTMADWLELEPATYPPREDRPLVERVAVDAEAVPAKESEEDADEIRAELRKQFAQASHRDVVIRSVIDLPLWNAARWEATAYVEFQTDSNILPGMALVFDNREVAMKIFERWRERFGSQRNFDDIRLSIIRNVDVANPHHYKIVIGSDFRDEVPKGGFVQSVSRIKLMEPMTGDNLQRFLENFERAGGFFLMPAFTSGRDAAPELLTDLAFPKQKLFVMDAADVGENDPEHVAVRV